MLLSTLKKIQVPYSTLEWAKQEIKRAQERNDPAVQPKQLASGEYIGITVSSIIKSDSGVFVDNPYRNSLHFLWNPDVRDWKLDESNVEIISNE